MTFHPEDTTLQRAPAGPPPGPDPPAHRRAPRPAYGLLWVLFGFTAVALLGFGVFALHPGNLARIPASAAGFFGVAYPFFAQAHVWLGGAVLLALLVRQVGRQWLGAFAAVYALSFLSEFVGTGYGLPFGPYGYTDLLGGKWFGRVPYLIPLSWFAMAVPSYALARFAFPGRAGRVRRVLFGAYLLAAWDLSLDPAMSYLTPYWQWGEPGVYYGMPLINLAGWYGTGLVIMAALQVLGAERWLKKLSVRWLALYYALTLLMPFGMVLAAGLWGAALATLAALAPGAWIIHTARKRGADTAETGPTDAPTTADTDRAEQLDTWAYFSHHSKSFSFAASLFPADERALVSGVYTFCRTTDDLVDEARHEPAEQVSARLDCWIDLARRAYEGQPSGIGWLDDVMAASARAGVPFELIEELAEGVRTDLGRVALQTVDELDLYAYRVASVVGIWMCYLFGVAEAWTLERAAALGRAMQITNILRDVGEDLRDDRVYLPADLLAKHGIGRQDLEDLQSGGPITLAYCRLIDEMMALAGQHYEKAWAGIIELPDSFGKAVAVAAEVYRGIHRGILRNGYDNIHHRARTTFPEKVRLGLYGYLRFARRRRAHRRARRTARVPHLAHPPASGRRTGLLARLNALVHALIVALYLVLPMSPSQAQPGSLERLRSYYLQSAEDEAYLVKAQHYIEQEPSLLGAADPVVEGYRAALTVMQAKHALWPGSKLRYLKEGLPVLDSLLERHPGHVELRYLRLLSCFYLPRFLKRGWSVDEDLGVLARLLPTSYNGYPPELYQTMVRFVLENGATSEPEQAALERALQVSLTQAGAKTTGHKG